MAHAQKPDFVFRAKRTSPFKSRGGGASVQSTAGTRGVRISGTNAGYTMFRGSVKGTGYPLLSPVFPSLPLPCVAVCHHISTGVCFTSCMQYNDIYCNLVGFTSHGIIVTPYDTFRCNIVYPKRLNVVAVSAGLLLSVPVALHLRFVPCAFTNIFSSLLSLLDRASS